MPWPGSVDALAGPTMGAGGYTVDGLARRKGAVSRYGVPVLTLRCADTGETIRTVPLETLEQGQRIALLNVPQYGNVELVDSRGVVLYSAVMR